MEINSLLESANGYKSLQADAARLADKWTQSGLLEGYSNEIDKNNMAMILENQAKQIVAEQSSTGTGAGFSAQAGAGENWAGVALPLVRKVFAQIAAKDFVSVQPMNLPSGLVFYLDFKYGTATNGRTVGDNMYGNVTTANSKIGVDAEVSGGLYNSNFGYSTNGVTSVYSSTNTGSVALADVDYDAFTFASGSFHKYSLATSTLSSSFDAEAVRSFRILSASVDITSHPEFTKINGANVEFIVSQSKVSVAGGAITPSVVYSLQPLDDSRGDFEDNPASSISIPEINVELSSQAIVAKTRKLKAQWTPEFSQDLNAYHSIDAEAELTSLLSEYISMEIDLEILDMLIAGAVTTERWSASSNKYYEGASWTVKGADAGGYYNTQGQWFQTLGTKIQKVSNKIHQKTLRGGANFLVTSPTVATILESIPGYAASTDGDQMDFAFGVQKIGQLNGRYRVYKNPYMTENTILLGYRGSQFLETGAVYAPYVPLIMTPLVYDPNTFTPRKGIMTRYAKEMIRPEFYGRIFVSDVNTI